MHWSIQCSLISERTQLSSSASYPADKTSIEVNMSKAMVQNTEKELRNRLQKSLFQCHFFTTNYT